MGHKVHAPDGAGVGRRYARSERLRLTVMLAATVDRRKLPPVLILKKKALRKSEAFPKDVIDRAQEKGWITEELIEWLKIIWGRRPRAFLN